jgi:hypothetical protein
MSVRSSRAAGTGGAVGMVWRVRLSMALSPSPESRYFCHHDTTWYIMLYELISSCFISEIEEFTAIVVERKNDAFKF